MLELIQSAVNLSRTEAAEMITAHYSPADRISQDATHKAQLRELLAITRRVQAAVYAARDYSRP